ncbi:MAG: serine/threonine-protein kinase, partial [Gemmatimonadaceae bacterium]
MSGPVRLNGGGHGQRNETTATGGGARRASVTWVIGHLGGRAVGSEPSDFRERVEHALGPAYRVERELRGGGMSRVFVAEDTRLGRRVVVKVLHPDLAADLSARRFEREVKLAARLQHPHILALISAGDMDGLPYYTMPYIEGESLRELLREGGALPLRDVLRLIRELADALEYAHGQGIVHRDLKPENVLLSQGHALVADLGIAKALHAAAKGGESSDRSTLTAAGLAVGTPAYMAPEQAVGDPLTDHRVDLYALGLIAYEMLAGTPPFTGGTPQQLIAAHIAQPPPPLALRRPDLPPALAALVGRLLE